MTMTPEAKAALCRTIRGSTSKGGDRGLRGRLVDDLRARLEGEYRLELPPAHAGLDERRLRLRGRLDRWLDEQARAAKGPDDVLRQRFLDEVVEQAAATLLNRLVFLRVMEARGLRREQVLTGGWTSRGYRDFRELAPGLCQDETEGYGTLLGLIFEELSGDLPGLFGDVGLNALAPIPDGTLRAVVEALDDPALATCWTDDTTPGWVYQYWNDPRREALDDKLNDGGKVEPHEVASKTQMFTERYMVEWLLQNALGATWFAICKKQGWTPEVQARGVLADLEARRADWRSRREAGEVELDALMPIEGPVEDRWKYWVEQPIPQDAVDRAAASVRDLRIIDPACGSGHFLVIAFDLLLALYREEARHRGEAEQPGWSDAAIVERIVEYNLAGIDLDPRAVQIAAAALWLKWQERAPDARPARMNLVASSLRLGALPAEDPARVELRRSLEAEVGLPGDLTDGLVAALAGADHIGSLLKVDAAIAESLTAWERRQARAGEPSQGDLLAGYAPSQQAIDFRASRATILAALESFLGQHGGGQDLGLRLRGEQLAAGVRLVRLLREGQYDLVVGNPPYQGTSKMADAAYVKKHYALGKADLYAAFLLRGLELAKEGGTSALLTMRNWMFIKQYAGLRERLLERYDLRALGDFAVGAFDEVPNDVLSVVVSVFRRAAPAPEESVALQPTPLDDKSYDRNRTARKRAGVLAGVGRFGFGVADLGTVRERPLLYWWGESNRAAYRRWTPLGVSTESKEGLGTKDDVRFLRKVWEVARLSLLALEYPGTPPRSMQWVPFVKGAAGTQWCEVTTDAVDWRANGLRIATYSKSRYGRGATLYFRQGVAFSTKGGTFSGRVHRFVGIFGHAGSSLFGDDANYLTCLLNRTSSRRLLSELNPTLGFALDDVRRLPLAPVAGADEVMSRVAGEFARHESHREPSVEYRRPGPSPWRYAQAWAQLAVDRPLGAPLPPYEPEYDAAPSTEFVSFGVGVALGRFGPDGEGILDAAPPTALPHGLLYLSEATEQDSLAHPACSTLRDAWIEHGPTIDAKRDLRTWLRTRFFADVHKGMYENRPIHFPLSSGKKTFVAFATIHRFTEDTLRALLADHLLPDLARLDGELADLRTAASSPDKQAARQAEDRLARVQGWRAELQDFIADVKQCAEQGPPPPDPRTPPRAADARYVMDLDDGVLVNSAGLWPLLLPQWKDPKAWWKQLATAPKAGNKDLDWSHLAARYFPLRVDQKCQKDPSLAVAHGCFWRYHPERAYSWELRLQDEIGPEFTLDEDGSDAARAAFEDAHPDVVEELVEKERKRREKKWKKAEKEAAQRDLFGGGQ